MTERLSLSYGIWWECNLVPRLWKTVWSFLKKLKVELPHDPAIPLLGIDAKKLLSLIRFHLFIFTFVSSALGARFKKIFL